MPDLIAHIGFPKTATTFLQKSVFPAIPDINYIDYHDCVKLLSSLIYLDDLDYSSIIVDQNLRPKLGDQTSLMSFEGLTGAPFIYKGLGRSLIAHRLKELGFNKIIITVRDQVSLIDSIYRQHILQGGVVKFKDFIDIKKKFNLYNRSFNLEYLNYYKLISLYHEVFGIHNVLVLSHKKLVTDKKSYVNDLVEFIKPGVPTIEISQQGENSSLSNLSINLLRIVNHFIFTSQKPNQLLWNGFSTKNTSRGFKAILDPFVFRFISSKRPFSTASERKYLMQYYETDNGRLKELLGEEFSL